MINLPSDFAPIILAFQPMMLNRTWQRAVVLMVGAILAPGQRTVCGILRIMGLGQEKQFQNFHRVLNRAAWDLRQGSRILLGLLIDQFSPQGPLLFGLDDTVERRWGPKNSGPGNLSGSSSLFGESLFKASGLRWLSLMLLIRIGWAQQVWALPVLTSLAPSERYYRERKPEAEDTAPLGPATVFPIATVVAAAEANVGCRWCVCRLGFSVSVAPVNIACITRLRLDARLYQPAPARSPGRAGRPA